MSATKQTHVCIKTNSRFHQNVQTYFTLTPEPEHTLSRCRRFVICGTMTRKLKVIRNPADCKSAGTTGRGRNTYPFTLPQIYNLRYDDTQAESNPESGRLQICRNTRERPEHWGRQSTGEAGTQEKPEHVPPQVQGVCMILPGSE